MNRPKKDRPLPEQPVTSAKFKEGLASKNLADMTFYVKVGQYYDGGMAAKLRETRTDGMFHFTKDFPPVSNPSPDMKELGEVLVHLFANELRERGYRVSDKACAECLGVAIDYSYRIDPTFVGVEEVLNLRTSISYNGVQFAQGWDDTKSTRNLGVGGEAKRWALRPRQEKELILAPLMSPLADQMLYVLKKVLGKDTSTK